MFMNMTNVWKIEDMWAGVAVRQLDPDPALWALNYEILVKS